MITRLFINGFKSFQNFEIYLSPFTIIAGTNASGKSNLFDALTLLADLAKGLTIVQAFHNVRGEEEEAFTLFQNGERAQFIEFEVDMLVDRKIIDGWGQKTLLNATRLRYKLKIGNNDEQKENPLSLLEESLEAIPKNKDKWKQLFKIKNFDAWCPAKRGGQRSPFIRTSDNIVEIKDNGVEKKIKNLNAISKTVLNNIDSVEFPHIYAARKEMQNWHFLHLSPNDLRKPSEYSSIPVLDPSGKNLASLLMILKKRDPYYLKAVARLMEKFIPNYVCIDVVRDEDKKKLVLKVTDNDGITYTSGVLSEGTLRIIALCVLATDDEFTGVLGFEEPENGIHPFRISTMAELISRFASDFSDPDQPLRQVIVNTHSPLFVLLSKELDNRFILRYISRMVTGIINKGDRRTKVSTTRITPVLTPEQSKTLDLQTGDSLLANISEKEFINFMTEPNLEENKGG